MNRSSVSPGTDSKVFRTTANKTKKVNVSPKIMRGGTRL